MCAGEAEDSYPDSDTEDIKDICRKSHRKTAGLDMVAGYIFPVEGKAHHGEQSRFADLAAAFYVLL